jgi:hypothetical protein
MEARINLYESSIAAKLTKHINSAGQVLHGSTLPRATQELVKIRAHRYR